MKANELLRNEVFANYEQEFKHLVIISERKQYRFAMGLGRVFPTTRPQAIEFTKNGTFGILSVADVQMIEAFCKKHGMENKCEYQLTISNKHALLIGYRTFIAALRLEYNF